MYLVQIQPADRLPCMIIKFIFIGFTQPYELLQYSSHFLFGERLDQEVQGTHLEQAHSVGFFRRNINNADLIVSKLLPDLLSDLHAIHLQKLDIQKT